MNSKTATTTAIAKIKGMMANLGGTKIFEPLQQILLTPIREGYPRNVFLLTDGCVKNVQAIIEMIEKFTNQSRVHSIGVGNGASTALI